MRLSHTAPIRLLAAMLFVGVFAADDATAQSKIGYTDAELILLNMPEAESVGTKLQDFVRTNQEMIQTQMSTFEDDFAKYQKQAQLLPAETRQLREAELQDRYQKLQQLGAQKEQEAAVYEQELMKPLFDRLNAAVAEVAGEQGLDLVVRSQALLFASDNMVDITLDVARKLGIQVDEPTAQSGS